jgi:hypothetical protein
MADTMIRSANFATIDQLSLLIYRLTALSLYSGVACLVNKETRDCLAQIDTLFTSAAAACNPPLTRAFLASLMTRDQLGASWSYNPCHALHELPSYSAHVAVPVPVAYARAINLFFTIKIVIIETVNSVPPSTCLITPPFTSSQTIEYLSILEQLECVCCDQSPASWLSISLAYVRSAVLLASGNHAAFTAAATRATRMLEANIHDLAFSPAYLIFPVHFMTFATYSLNMPRIQQINQAMEKRLREIYPAQVTHVGFMVDHLPMHLAACASSPNTAASIANAMFGSTNHTTSLSHYLPPLASCQQQQQQQPTAQSTSSASFNATCTSTLQAKTFMYYNEHPWTNASSSASSISASTSAEPVNTATSNSNTTLPPAPTALWSVNSLRESAGFTDWIIE